MSISSYISLQRQSLCLRFSQTPTPTKRNGRPERRAEDRSL